MSENNRGPSAYENWKAAEAGDPLQAVFEQALFTDAQIVGEIRDGCGPYQLLNTVPIPPDAQMLVPAIVLRVEYYLDYLDEMKMDQTDTRRYHGGGLSDEIAALVSLSLGIRLQAGSLTRRFESDGDPKGRPVGPVAHENPTLIKPTGRTPILPRVLGTHFLSEINLVTNLPDLSPSDAIALVRSARLYQDAIWIAESEPQLSWIMLVSAIETAAGHWRASREPPVDRLRASQPELEKLLQAAGGEQLVLDVADLIADYMGATKKFIDFSLEFMPSDPPKERPPKFARHPWNRRAMKKSLRIIYNWRSRALHGGIPFPLPMCEPPWKHDNAFAEKPSGLATKAKSGVWVAKDTPMLLHTFEYIVRHALLNWWEYMLQNQEAIM